MKPSDFETEPEQSGVVIHGGAEALRPYVGQVVAIVDGVVQVSGKTWGECLDAVSRSGLVDPEMLYVPMGAFVG